MSIDKVQSSSTLNSVELAQRLAEGGDIEQNEQGNQPVVQIDAEKDLNRGVTVQHDENQEVDAGNQEVRAAANQQNVDEVNALKEQSAALAEQAAAANEEVAAENQQQDEVAQPPVARQASSAQSVEDAQRIALGLDEDQSEQRVDNATQQPAPTEQQTEQPTPQPTPQQPSQPVVQQQSLDQANQEIAAYKREKQQEVDREMAALRQQARQQLNDEIAAMKQQAQQQISAMTQQAKEEINQLVQQAAVQNQGEVVANAPEQPAEDNGRLVDKIDKDHRYLVDLKTKELKKIARSDDEVAAGYAKMIIEERKHERSIWTPTELTDNERAMVDAAVEASGNDKPLYKNATARRILRKDLRNKNEKVVEALDKKIEEAKTQEEKDALQIYRDAFADKDLSRKQAKALVSEMKIKDRVEHTVVVDSNKDKKVARQKLGDEEGDFRVKRHNKKLLKNSDEVRIRMAQAEAAGEPISSHQAEYEVLTTRLQNGKKGRISGDGVFEKSEIQGTATYNNTTYNAARSELKRLGFDVDDGRAANIVGPLVTAAATAAAVYALPLVVEVTATALATATAGGVTATASTTAEVTAAVHPLKQAGIGAGTAGILAAIFGFNGSEEIDLLRSVDRCDLFNDIDDGNGGKVRQFELYRYNNDANKDKAIKDVLRAIDDLEITDKQKVQLLNEAAGEKGLKKLTMKELILGYIKGMDMDAGAEEEVEETQDCGCNENEKDKEVKKDEDKKDTTPTPKDRIKYEVEEVEATKTRTIPTLKFGGPYHYAQYYLVDGKPIKYKSPEYKAIIAKLNNGAMQEANGRKDRVLSEEIDLGNGKVAKLVSDEDIAKIRKTQHPTGGGKDVRYKTLITKDGYAILYKVEGEKRTEIKRGPKEAIYKECLDLNKAEEEKMKEQK